MATDNVVNELIINKLTQAQFDAIPEAERSDTELYFITDAEISGGKGAQVEEIPEATESNLGQIVQYVGETIQDTDTSTITQVVGNSLTNLKVDSKKFAEKLGITAAETVEFTHNINRGFNNTLDYIYPGGNAVSVVITNPTLLLTAVEQFLEHYPEHSINSLVKILFDIGYSEEKSQNIVINIGTAFSDNPDTFYPITGHIDYDLDEEHIGVVVGNEYPANEVWSVVFDVLNQVFWKNDNIDVVLPSDGTIHFTTTKGNITFECDYQSFINYLTNTSIIPYNWKNEDIPEYLLKSSFTYNAGNNCWVYPPLAGIDDSWVRNFMQVSGDVQDGDSVEYVLTLPNEGNVITNINQYGITYSGTPSTDDKIKVDYYPPVSGYEKGYFYTNKEQLTSPEVIITQTTGTSLSNLKIDRDTFIKVENPTSDLTTIFEVVSGGTRYEIEEKVGDYELSIDVSKVVAFAIDKLHPELKQGFLNGEQLRITIQDYRNQPDNSAYPWWVDIWTPSTGTINAGNRMATYWVTDIFGVDFDAESINDIGTLVFSCYYSEPTWIKNNDSQVTLRDYGISFNKGIPAAGDVITVDYKLPTSYGMSWEQINVQPSTGSAANIEWATILDIPADFPSDYRVGCSPIWSVPADLPDGTYEFYIQTLCGSESLVTVGLYNYTVKVLVKFYTESGNRYYTGSISYVLDGSWTGDADHYPDNSDYYECFKINGDNLNFCIGSSPFYSTIPQSVRGVDIPGVFKISAWKNIDSGEQYIPEGTLYKGSYEGTNLLGSLQSYKLWPGLHYPSYYSNCTINLDPNYQYINFMPFDVLTGTFCQELEIYMKSSTGGEYHAVVKSQDWSCFIQECEASGDLANVQLGLTRSNGSYIYINDKNNSVSQVEIQVSTSGMAHTDQAVYLQYFQDIVDDFIPLSVCKVGAPVTKRNLDKVLQYTQESTDKYTQGYFYKSSGTTVSVPASMEINWQSVNGVEILIDAEKLVQALSSHVGWDISYLKEDLLNAYYRWTYYEHESQPYVYADFYGYFWDSDIAECFTINGELPDGYIEFQAGGYKDSSVEVIDGKWEQINVQPASNAIQVTEMPEASEENAGKILQYIGTPTSEYDQGYFYKSVVVSQTESSISASIKEGEPYADELSVSIDSEKFIAVIDKEFGSSSGLYRVAFSVSADRIILAKLTTDGKTEKSVMFYWEPTLENLYGEVGITLTLAESGSAPDLSNYATVRVDIVYSAQQTICEWRQVNVQPSSGGGGDYLPLSGGTITGDLVIKNDSSNTVEPILTLSHGSNDIVIKKLRYGKELDFDNTTLSNLTGVVPAQSNGQLGTTGAFWSRAYVRNLNAGAPSGKDLLVPSKAGTLATLGDIPEGTQLETLPAASADNLNKIYQYTGETTTDYINGYFYKSTNDIAQDLFATGYAQYDTSLTLIVTVDKEKFLAQNPVWQDVGVNTWRADYDESTGEWYVWTQQPNIYISNTDLKDVWGIDVTNVAGDYVPANGDTLMVQLTESESFLWQQIDVQPNTNMNIPAHPTTPGSYMLMCTVGEDGTVSYSWETVA